MRFLVLDLVGARDEPVDELGEDEDDDELVEDELLDDDLERRER